MARVILLLCVALGLTATSAEAEPCPGQKTIVFFVNGVWVSPTDAQESVNALKERLSNDLGCDLPVVAAYNQTVNRAEDLWAASQKLGNPIDPALARLLAKGAIELVLQDYPGFALDAARFFTGEIVRNIVAFTGQPISPDDEDVRTHYGQYVLALNAGYRVVLVGHSEGNLFTNLEFDGLVGANPTAAPLLHVVAIATPSYRVASDPLNSRYTTLRGDPIAGLADFYGRKALTWNVESADCDEHTAPVIGGLLCHQFDTYLHRTESWESIGRQIRQLLDPNINVVINATLDGQEWSGVAEYSVATPVTTSRREALPGALSDQAPGTYSVSYLSGGPIGATFTGVVPNETQRLTHGGKITFTLQFTTIGAPASHPPTAHFIVTSAGNSSPEGAPFAVTTDPSTGEARVTFTDQSSDPDGDSIASRTWTADTACTPGGTPPCLLASGLATFTWGFRAGTYNVTLRVTDGHGGEDTATARIEVTAADPGARVWPMNGHDARRTSRSAFNGPATRPVSPHWVFPTSEALVGGLSVSAEGRVYFASDKFYALESDGQIFAQRPFPDVPGRARPVVTSPAIDDANGFVYFGAYSAAGGWDLLRFNKDLSASVVLAHGDQLDGLPSEIIVDNEGVFFFVNHRSGAVAYALGSHPWTSAVCTSRWIGAPAIGTDGHIYGACSDVGNLKLDRTTGGELARGGGSQTELMIDDTGHLWGGYPPAGGFLSWNPDLTLASNTCCEEYIVSRASLFSDGTSTVRTGYASRDQRSLTAIGANVWKVQVADPGIFTTDPSVDASNRVFVGASTGLYVLKQVDGTVDWTFATPFPVTGQPVITDGAVYFATTNGDVYRLRQPAGSQPAAPAITTVEPLTVYAGPADQLIRLSGTGFTCPEPSVATACSSVEVYLNGGLVATLHAPEQVQSVSAASMKLAVTFGNAGAYSLVAVNADGVRSVPFDISVQTFQPAVLSKPSIVAFDGNLAPEVAGRGLGELVSDRHGNLLTLKSSGTCAGCRLFTLLSLSPYGSVNWEATEGEVEGAVGFGSDSQALLSITLGADDDVFLGISRIHVGGYRSGAMFGNWPQVVVGDRFASGVLADELTGNVFVATTSPFPGGEFGATVFNRNGSPALSMPGVTGTWYRGLGGHPYLVHGLTITRYDRETLAPACSSPLPAFVTFGSAEGIFGTGGSTIYKTNADCQTSPFATVAGVSFSIHAILGDRLVGLSSPDLLGTRRTLTGVSLVNGSVWTQESLELAPSGVANSDIIVRQGETIYMLALDRSDGLKQKLAILDANNGSILAKLGTSGLCDNSCQLEAAADGRVYLQESGSSKIFRVPRVVHAGGQTNLEFFNVDELQALRVNGQLLAEATGSRSFELATLLQPGLNLVEVEVVNGAGLWSFGYNLWIDGNIAVSASCGQSGGAGCDGNSQRLGTVLRESFLIVK